MLLTWHTDHSPIHLRLSGLPKSSTPSDITRMLMNHKVENVAQVNLEYNRFSPTGSAFVTLTHSDFLRPALKALQRVVWFAHPIAAYPTEAPKVERMRGGKGRDEAADRDIVSGTGSGLTLSDNGRNVILSGLPARITDEKLRALLKGYRLAGGRSEIQKLDTDPGPYLITSRVLVRLAFKSEAYRLVRNTHMTELAGTEVFANGRATGQKHLIHAQVVL
ncbi:hypothetical protein FA95DRAFT_1493596 [Auriscalpium vulgare]|uniref:Uncharacterized protein n=1 Tax=Auriscalpium vulgare TaxID=40419 RepID=A0ACB8RRB7_9AGAM|nr:hypothetical protein FA95DRAFT_1493596 [Auriscalpium vulgare]